MSFINSLKISSSGLRAQRIKMDLISSNLANIDTININNINKYKKKEVILKAVPLENEFNKIFNDKLKENILSEVQVEEIVEENREPIFKYEPQNPYANSKGYIEMPNINIMEEMVNMMAATRGFEANVTAINATKLMALKALEIGS